MDFNPALLQQLLERDLQFPFVGLTAFRADMLRRTILKKYVAGGSSKALRSAAFLKFQGINDSIKPDVVDLDFQSTELFLLWKGVLQKALLSGEMTGPRVTMRGCFEHGNQGPGVTNGNSDTLFFTKMFNSDLTTTSGSLYNHYVYNLGARWSIAESERKQHHCVKVVPGSVLSTVPKDREEERTTCKEPTLNMFYQLGAKEQFECVLRDQFCIDLSNQPHKNRFLAKQGSIDGSFATLDLKSASDSISLKLCELLLPPCILDVLMKIRSSRTHIGTDLVQLNMISTMGNGFTFALMTLLFASLIKAVFILHKRKCVFGSSSDQKRTHSFIANGKVQEITYSQTNMHTLNCAVFGDDIIVPTDLVADITLALSKSGFTLNVGKSFVSGPFRESCGGDYLNGDSVRGVYIKRMNNESAVYSAFNRLHAWAISTGIPLERTLRYLMGRAKFRPVPLHHGEDQGFLCTLAFSGKSVNKSGSVWYHHIAPSPDIIQCNDRFLYHNAGLITFLGGYMRDYKMLRRTSGTPKYIVAKSCTLYWDYSSCAGLTSQDYENSWESLIS